MGHLEYGFEKPVERFAAPRGFSVAAPAPRTRHHRPSRAETQAVAAFARPTDPRGSRVTCRTRGHTRGTPAHAITPAAHRPGASQAGQLRAGPRCTAPGRDSPWRVPARPYPRTKGFPGALKPAAREGFVGGACRLSPTAPRITTPNCRIYAPCCSKNALVSVTRATNVVASGSPSRPTPAVAATVPASQTRAIHQEPDAER